MRYKGIFALLILFSFISLPILYAQGQKQVEPVNWRELIPFLGEIPGWEAEEKPEGSTVSMQGFKISRVERSYTAGDRNLEIEIVDGSYFPAVYSPFKMAMSFELDTSERYVKKITIKDFPGIEQYEYEDKEAEIMILVADRFLVRLEGDNIEDPSEMIAIANALDLEGIAELAK